MTSAARSIQIFGLYLFALAAMLLIAPNLLLSVFGIPSTSEVWIRVVGMLAGFLGFYYWRAAAAGLSAFFAWTIPVRLSVMVFFLAFVVLGWAPPVLLVFGAADVAGAIWTWLSLRGK